MNFLLFINLAVAFLVFVIIWTALSFTVLPTIAGKIGLPSLKPEWLWRGLYAGLSKAAEYCFVSIIWIFLFLYIIYKILNMLPGFLLMMIGWMWPPFIQCVQSGIFPFFDSIIGAIFSNDTIETRLRIVAYGVEGLLTDGFVYLANTLIEIGLFPNAKPHIPSPSPLRPVPVRTPNAGPAFISDKVQAGLDEKYNECLQQNLVNITPNMSALEITNATLKNQSALVNCKLGQLYGSITILGERAGSDLSKSIKK